MKTHLLAWLHAIVTLFHNRLAAVEAKHGITSPTLDMHPEVAAAAAEHAPAPWPTPAVAAPVGSTIPLGPLNADGKPTAVFPGGDLAAFQTFTAEALKQHGYGIVIVNTAGQPLDTRGDVIAAAGALPDYGRSTLDWTKPGEAAVCTEPSKTYSLSAPGPAHLEINIGETTIAGTSAPDQVRVTLDGGTPQLFTNVHGAKVDADIVAGGHSFLVEQLDVNGSPQPGRSVSVLIEHQP